MAIPILRGTRKQETRIDQKFRPTDSQTRTIGYRIVYCSISLYRVAITILLGDDKSRIEQKRQPNRFPNSYNRLAGLFI